VSKHSSSKRSSSKRSRTSLRRLDSLKSRDIDLSDLPEVTPERFARAVVREGLAPLRPKEQITLRLDSDVLRWFRAQGRGYQTKINSLLRAYMEASNRK
jgi:uncharacterized protein (DUF4415 family)